MTERARAVSALAASTVAFTACFAVWMMYGVLATFLVDSRIYGFSREQLGWLIGIPVLSGALLRMPIGMLSDRFGGRAVMAIVMVAAAAACYAASFADSFRGFLLGGLGFGVSGSSFVAGIAYTASWFPEKQQGTALGIFGAGNAGAAVTALVAPRLLEWLTRGGLEPERWRMLPRLYAAALLATALLFWLTTFPRPSVGASGPSLRQRLEPLRLLRVWRFGLYYFLVFGGFVALSQWLIPYYVNVYALGVVAAGFFSAVFSLPAGLIRALGGWLSDRFGPRTVMSGVLGISIPLLVLLFPPRVELQSPGQGVVAIRPGTVRKVSDDEVVVGEDHYHLEHEDDSDAELRIGVHRDDEGFHPLPSGSVRHVPVVSVGDRVVKGQLLMRGVTRIYFQANRWIFTTLVLLLGLMLGLGTGAVLKYVALDFPGRVGAVSGIVGMLGALGGLLYPIAFGYLLAATGIWTTCWMLLAIVALICLVWLRLSAPRRARMLPDREPASGS